eukprot:1932700-Amphidinium_carterae.2
MPACKSRLACLASVLRQPKVSLRAPAPTGTSPRSSAYRLHSRACKLAVAMRWVFSDLRRASP